LQELFAHSRLKLVAARGGVSRKLAFKTAVTHIIPIIER
jgi:hypothetical protein